MLTLHITVRSEDPKIRVYISQLPIGIELGQIYEVFKAYGIVCDIIKIERIIQGRKIDTGDRVIIFTRIAINIPLYVYVGVLSSITEASRKPAEFVVVLTIWPRSVQKLEVNKT